jgi:hypothetical protein
MTARQESRGLGRALLALVLVALAAGGALAETLTESLVELQRTTREYQESLARLLEVHEQDAARAEASAEKYRTLYPQGLVSRRDVETADHAAAQARARVEETRGHMAEAERAHVEAHALWQLALLPPVAPGQERATPGVLEYRGVSRWTLDQVASLERFFTARFGHALPVSAVGQTPLHDRLGFDHRNALDVALHPDSVEGRALLDHLRARGVPFLAFRGAVAGASTGAHVHVGAASPRKG